MAIFGKPTPPRKRTKRADADVKREPKVMSAR